MLPGKHAMTNNHALVADLYRSYAPTLLTYIYRQLSSREDAEDILLEVFQAAVESDSPITLNEGEQRGWLWTVARRKVSDHYRRVYRRPVSDTMLEEVDEVLYEDEVHAPEHFVLRQEAYAELRVYVSSLPELQQNILRLRFAYGFTYNEIAQHLNKSSAAVRVMLSRSINLLRDHYQQHNANSAGTDYGS
jgi:RNA polymerase sigma factor (sigma-70 family)